MRGENIMREKHRGPTGCLYVCIGIIVFWVLVGFWML